MEPTGLIFDIKKYAINDGPGIRLTVFFKGCPLHCAWCHNPESISGRIQKMYNPDKCIGCRSCIEACSHGACSLTPEGIITDRTVCHGCGDCADICPTVATEMSGRVITARNIIDTAEKERVFFDESGGGVTLSGGEPLQQAAFLISLLDALGKRDFHRAVDTTGFVKTQTLLDVAKRTDLFLYDLKLMDSKRHERFTGVGNELIHKNLIALAATGVEIIIRIPLIEGVNADRENMMQTAKFIRSLSGARKQIHLLPYHDIAANKYRRLGQSHDASGMHEPEKLTLDAIKTTFTQMDLDVTVGG